MRKIKLLSALLAIVMVLPLVAGLTARVTADGPRWEVMTWPKTPNERATIESLGMPKLADYAQGSMLVEGTQNDITELAEKNIQFAQLGRADITYVGGMALTQETKGSKILTLPKLRNETLVELSKYDYPNIDFAYYIVRMVGPMKRAWIDKINSVGGYIMDGYQVSKNTYIVRMEKIKAGELSNLDFVKGYTMFNPALKTTLFPANTESKATETVSIALAGNLTDKECEILTDNLKGMGAKTMLRSMLERYLEEKAPGKVAGMKDEEYDALVKAWKDERQPMIDWINSPVEEGAKLSVFEASNYLTIGTVGQANDIQKDPALTSFEMGFIHCIVPKSKIADIAKLPWVINIDLFTSPEPKNDLVNYTINSHWAWSDTAGMSGVVSDPTAPLPGARPDLLDHFGLHGESLQPSNPGHIGGSHYRQIVAVCGTGLDTGDVTLEAPGQQYYTSDRYGTSSGDFRGRVVWHMGYTTFGTNSIGNWSNNNTMYWLWPPTGTTRRRSRVPRGGWSNTSQLTTYRAPTGGSGDLNNTIGSRANAWMDWDGHDTHVTGSGFGDGFWSRGSSPADTTQDRNPYGIAPNFDPQTSVAPGTPASNADLPVLPAGAWGTFNTNPAGYGPAGNGPKWDYRGVAYRAGIVVQRVTDANFVRAYTYFWWPINAYKWYWAYAGRPRYMGLYNLGLGVPHQQHYLRTPDAVYSVVNDAYVVGARIQVNAWLVPGRGTYHPNIAGLGPAVNDDRLDTYDPLVYMSNEYNHVAMQMDKFCWERKDMLLVQAGTTNTRFAAPFIYDFEPYDWTGTASLPQGSQNWYDGNPHYYSSPWCFTTPNTAIWHMGTTNPAWLYPRSSDSPPHPGGPRVITPVPGRGIYYPPIGDTSQNLPVEFSYYNQATTQPPTYALGQNNPTTLNVNSDGKTDFGTSALSPATAKNPITVGASESYRSIQFWINNTTPWTYGAMYAPWFPQSVNNMGAPQPGFSNTSRIFSDNTANSDAPAGVVTGAGAEPPAGPTPGTWTNQFPNPVNIGAGDNGAAYGMVAAFSGRGPTPDLDYSQANPAQWTPAGRIKPDIVAPGTQIMSTASYLTNLDISSNQGDGIYSGNQWNGIRQVNNTNEQQGGPYLARHPGNGIAPAGGNHTLTRHYAIMEGTSCATGFVGGAAAIVRQFYQNQGLTTYPQPSAALIKATLIHGAANLGGQGNYDPQWAGPGTGNYNDWWMLSAKPSYDQGFGRLDIRKSLFPAQPTTSAFDDHTVGIMTGERHTKYYDILDDTVPFEITLAWTDINSTPQPQVALLNDLDLLVIDPGGTEYHGNIYATNYKVDAHTPVYETWGRISQSNPGGTVFDRSNNVERVVVPPVAIKKGTWTVIVSGTTISQTSPNNPQSYAYIASGGSLRGAVTPPPEVPATSPITLLLIVVGMIVVGGLFMSKKRSLQA